MLLSLTNLMIFGTGKINKKRKRKTEACRQSQAKTRLKKFFIQPSLEFWQLLPEFQDVTQIFLNHRITV